MNTKKEDFLQSWLAGVKKAAPGIEQEVAERMGNELWIGREINRAVVDSDFNLLAHRYFHGVGSILLQILLLTLPPEMTVALPLIIGEQQFSFGFMCGVAHERGWDVNTVASAEDTAACLEGRPSILKTREELDQEDALPFATIGEGEDALPEGFGGIMPPAPSSDEDQEENGGYF